MATEVDVSAQAAGAATPPQASVFERFFRATELDVRTVAMVIALAVIWGVLAILTDGIFLSARNLSNLAVQGSVVAIMATGMVLVIVARHIDLSVGSVLGFVSMVVGFLMVQVFPVDAAWGWPLAMVIGLITGVLVGLWQGVIIAYVGVPAFVVTLGGLLIFRGGVFLISNGRTIAPLDPTFQLIGGGAEGSIGATWSWIVGIIGIILLTAAILGGRAKRKKYGFPLRPLWAEWGLIILYAAAIIAFVQIMNSFTRPRTDIPRGIPAPVLILILVVVVMTFISRATRFGRYVFAMGGNPEAVELAGIDTKRVTVQIFVIMGVLCAIAGMVQAARLQSSANLTGTLDELRVIAATVIGGTSLAGGIGTVPGAILGAVVIFSIINGLVLLGASSSVQQIALGLVLIAAVGFDVTYTKYVRTRG